MLEEYLRQIEELLSTSPAVRDVEIVRRTVRDTALEKVLNYRYRVILADGGFVEMTERVLEVQGTLEMTKYRHHWQDGNGVLMDVKRQTSTHPGNPDQVVDGRARKLIAALIEKEPGQLGIAMLRQVAVERPQFIGLERLLGRQAPFETLNPDAPVCEVDVLALQAAEFGDA